MLRYKTKEEADLNDTGSTSIIHLPNVSYFGRVIVNKSQIKQYYNVKKRLGENFADSSYVFSIYDGSGNYTMVYKSMVIEISSPEEVAQEVLDYIKQVPSIKRLKELFEEA